MSMFAKAVGPSGSKEAMERCVAERKVLQEEEKALKESLKMLQAQLTQLQVEALDIRARARQQQTTDLTSTTKEEVKARMVKGEAAMVQVSTLDAEDEVNAGELDLGVNHNDVLDQVRKDLLLGIIPCLLKYFLQMMRCRVKTDATMEEEEDSD